MITIFRLIADIIILLLFQEFRTYPSKMGVALGTTKDAEDHLSFMPWGNRICGSREKPRGRLLDVFIASFHLSPSSFREAA